MWPSLNDSLVFVGALVVVSGVTPVARHLAVRLGFTDKPGPRKIHASPMPLLGGGAVYLATVVALAAFATDEAWSQMLGILIASTLVLGVGLLDDYGLLPSQFKLRLAMPLAAAILIGTGIHSEMFHPVERLPFVGLPGAWLDYLVSFIWIIGITASFSILDHMDGLCAGVSMVAAAVFFFLAQTGGQIVVSALAAALVGASVGFLVWNFNPARIFLGDAGAMFLGLSVATLGITLRFPDLPAVTSWMGPVLVLAVPIFDTTLITVSRLRRRLNPMSAAGKDHTAHRLCSVGLSHRAAVLTLYGLSAAAGLLAVWVTSLPPSASVRLAATVGAVSLAAIIVLERTPYERQTP